MPPVVPTESTCSLHWLALRYDALNELIAKPRP